MFVDLIKCKCVKALQCASIPLNIIERFLEVQDSFIYDLATENPGTIISAFWETIDGYFSD